MDQFISTFGRAFVCKIDDKQFPFDSHAEREEQHRASKDHAADLVFSLDMIGYGEERHRTLDQYRQAWQFAGDDQHISVSLGKSGPVFTCRTDKKSFDTLAGVREHIAELN